MAELSGTNLAGSIVPFTTDDTFATHLAKFGKGGWRSVADTAERDGITADRREAGMAVYVVSEKKVYTLESDLVTWTELKTGPEEITVKHDDTLQGEGTEESPLGLSDTVKSDIAGKADKADTLAGYGITDAYTKTETDAKLSAVYHAKGSVANYDSLPDGASVGDVYNLLDTGANYVWTESGWDKLSENVDLSGLATKDDLSGKADKTEIPTQVSQLENDSGYVTQADLEGASLPDQTGNNGKFLMTDGSKTSWEKAIKNNATVDTALAIGSSSRVTTNRTIAVGHNSQAHSGGAAAFGGGAYASASNSVAIGTSAITWGDNSVALGYNSKTDHNPDENYSSENSVAIGYSATSKGNSQVIIGDTALGSGNNSIAIGKNAKAVGLDSVVIGSNAVSNSPQGANVVIGKGAVITESCINSTAIGIDARAENYDATAIGRNTIAGAQYSFAAGYAAQTDPTYCNYNLDTSQPVVAVGFGAVSRSNGTIAIGQNVYADGPYSIVIGQDSTVEEGKDYCIAIGKETQVVGHEGISVGHSSNSARHGIALGTRANANAFGTIAIGLNTFSSISNAVAIGNQSYAHGQDSVALGSSAGVADGAGFAVQLGIGTNYDANTLQFRDYTVVKQDGTIPPERLSSESPAEGFTLVYDSQAGALRWAKAGGDETAGTEVIIRRWN